MKTLKHLALFAAVTLIMTGCSSVKFYSDEELKVKTGFKFYPSVPYILVDHSSGKEKISLIWLPDLKNPQYLRIRPGIGSSDIKLAFKDGALTSFGIASDTDIPGMINSLATLVSKSTTLFTAPAPSGYEESAVQEANLFDLYEILVENDTTILRKIRISDLNPF